MLTLAKSTELQNVVVPAKKGRGWDDLLTHAECQRLYKGKDFVVTLRVEIPGQEIKILGKKSSEEESRKPRCSKVWEKLYDDDDDDDDGKKKKKEGKGKLHASKTRCSKVQSVKCKV